MSFKIPPRKSKKEVIAPEHEEFFAEMEEESKKDKPKEEKPKEKKKRITKLKKIEITFFQWFKGIIIIQCTISCI